MLCPRCGLMNDDNNTYCTKCGARLDGKENTNNVYTQNDGSAAPGAEQIKAGSWLMLLGILSLAVPTVVFMIGNSLCNSMIETMTVSAFYTILFAGALLGIAFAVICKSRIKRYEQEYGVLKGKARWGRSLSTASMIINILLGLMFGLVLFTFSGTQFGNYTVIQLLDGTMLQDMNNYLLGMPTVTASPVPEATPMIINSL